MAKSAEKSDIDLFLSSIEQGTVKDICYSCTMPLLKQKTTTKYI